MVYNIYDIYLMVLRQNKKCFMIPFGTRWYLLLISEFHQNSLLSGFKEVPNNEICFINIGNKIITILNNK